MGRVILPLVTLPANHHPLPRRPVVFRRLGLDAAPRHRRETQEQKGAGAPRRQWSSAGSGSGGLRQLVSGPGCRVAFRRAAVLRGWHSPCFGGAGGPAARRAVRGWTGAGPRVPAREESDGGVPQGELPKGLRRRLCRDIPGGGESRPRRELWRVPGLGRCQTGHRGRCSAVGRVDGA